MFLVLFPPCASQSLYTTRLLSTFLPTWPLGKVPDQKHTYKLEWPNQFLIFHHICAECWVSGNSTQNLMYISPTSVGSLALTFVRYCWNNFFWLFPIYLAREWLIVQSEWNIKQSPSNFWSYNSHVYFLLVFCVWNFMWSPHCFRTRQLQTILTDTNIIYLYVCYRSHTAWSAYARCRSHVVISKKKGWSKQKTDAGQSEKPEIQLQWPYASYFSFWLL